MNESMNSRRWFLKATGGAVGALFLYSTCQFTAGKPDGSKEPGNPSRLHPAHRRTPIEIAPKRIISGVTYNGQFPGPLLRFKEGRSHHRYSTNRHSGAVALARPDGFRRRGWRGRRRHAFIPAHGTRRISFTPRPSGFRFYHTHNRAGANLSAGQYSGQVGPVYIEPKHEPGSYDREVFLVLKEFEPTFSHGGDMAQDFLSPGNRSKSLKLRGESSMKASLARACRMDTKWAIALSPLTGECWGTANRCG